MSVKHLPSATNFGPPKKKKKEKENRRPVQKSNFDIKI